MLKKLLLATTVCIALSACNDSSSSSSTEPSEPLATLSFENLSDVSSIARVETSSEDGSHLIGFDANGAPIGDISNMGVEDFTPTSDGGFVVEVSEKHKAIYKYTQGLAPVDSGSDDASALKKLIAAVTGDKPVVDVTQTFRRPVWYYISPTGDYYLVTNNKNLPDFIGENSKKLLVFSNGETFDLTTKRVGQLFNSFNPSSIADIIKDLQEESDIKVAAELKKLLDEHVIEQTKNVSQISDNTILAYSDVSQDNVLIFTNINDAPLALKAAGIFISKKLNQKKVNNIIQLPDSTYTLLGQNIGLLNDSNGKINDTDKTSNQGDWDGEATLGDTQAWLLSQTQNAQDCPTMPQQCLYTLTKTESGKITKVTTINSDFVLDSPNGFNTSSQAGQIEGGQQNYLWVNDSYIVIKEATQISIIDRADNNKLLDPILKNTEIDTINLAADNKLYITATDSSNTPAAYIYDIATDTMSNDISNGEKLHALKALIK